MMRRPKHFVVAQGGAVNAGTGASRASGAFNGLAQGATNNSSSLTVVIDTGAVGVKSGTATIALQSEGTGTSGQGC